MTREYFVRPFHAFFHDIKVMAKSKEHAIELVNDLLAKNHVNLGDLYYMGTRPEEEWTVLLQKDVDKFVIENESTEAEQENDK